LEEQKYYVGFGRYMIEW